MQRDVVGSFFSFLSSLSTTKTVQYIPRTKKEKKEVLTNSKLRGQQKTYKTK